MCPLNRPVMIAGATGWLGRAVVSLAEKKGLRVVALSRDAYGREGAVKCDVTDLGQLALRTKEYRPSVIINCVRVLNDRRQSVVRNLLRVSRQVGARFVHVGSAAEYGNGPSRRRIGEGHRIAPLNPYGHAKARESRFVLDAANLGMECLVARVFNLTGPGEDERTVGGAWGMRLANLSASHVTTVAVPGSIRDFLDVRDAASALLVLATAHVRYRVFNVCSGRGVRVDNLVRRLAALARKPVKVVRTRSSSLPGGPELLRSVGSPRRMLELGWRPLIPLNQSLKEVIVQYVDGRNAP